MENKLRTPKCLVCHDTGYNYEDNFCSCKTGQDILFKVVGNNSTEIKVSNNKSSKEITERIQAIKEMIGDGGNNSGYYYQGFIDALNWVIGNGN